MYMYVCFRHITPRGTHEFTRVSFMIKVTVTHFIEDAFGKRAEALGAPATQMTYARHGERVSVSTAVYQRQ